MFNMNDKITEGLKKALYTGVGAAAVAVDVTGKAINTLAKKGEQAIEKGKAMNEELRAKREQARLDIKTMASSLEKLTKEELEAIRAKLAEVECSFEQAHEEAKVNASAILNNLEKLGREELTVIKAKLDELKAEWNDDNDKPVE